MEESLTYLKEQFELPDVDVRSYSPLVLAYLFTFRLGKQEQVKTPKGNKTEEK